MFALTAKQSQISQSQIDKDRQLAQECEKLSIQVYRQIVDALPDQKTKDLFAHYSMLVSAQHYLGHATPTDTRKAYATYLWVTKQVRKLLGKS